MSARVKDFCGPKSLRCTQRLGFLSVNGGKEFLTAVLLADQCASIDVTGAAKETRGLSVQNNATTTVNM